MAQIIIRTCRGREVFLEYLMCRLPEARVAVDTTQNAMDTFRLACRIAGDGEAVHMEDDVILARGFTDKLMEAIAERRDVPIQFFSMRKADKTIGSRYDRSFLMGQCFYLPAGMSAKVLEYSQSWGRIGEHPTGLDTMVGDYLKANRIRHWIHVPSLVQHRQCESMIDRRRSKFRQSQTFCNPDVD